MLQILPFTPRPRGLRVAVVLPRGMRFSPQGATSIDLCAADFVRHSRFAATTHIVCEAVEAPFDGYRLAPFGEAGRRLGPRARLRAIADRVAAVAPDLVVVHQHLPTAAALGAAGWRVVLHAHGYQSPPGWWPQRLHKRRQYAALSGLIFVSASCRADFERRWREIALPRAVVHNGLDMAAWRPAAARERLIVYAGRAAPEKGVVEAAEAVAGALARRPGWRALFLLAASQEHPATTARLRALGRATGGALEIVCDAAFAQVRQAMERAAIALTPTLIREAFGRAALEAHAGGAALVSSGRGGLREVSGDACLYADPDKPASLAHALDRLIRNEALRNRLALEGRLRAQRLFDIRACAADLDDFYEEAAAQAAVSGGA